MAGCRAAPVLEHSVEDKGRLERVMSSASVANVLWVCCCSAETQDSPPQLAICFTASADSSHVLS